MSIEAAKVPQIKGVAMLNAVRALRTIDKARAYELLPDHLHKYLGEERILPVAWYPESDMLEMNRALAKLMRPSLPGATLEQTFVHMGQLVARIDLSSVYASAVRTRPLEETARMLAAMWKQYHDTGSLEVSLEPKSGRFELRDYGLPSRELCWIQRGWFLGYIELHGSSELAVTETHCRNRGAVSCVWNASWS
jgi:predicted hydrocarbon binding protein